MNKEFPQGLMFKKPTEKAPNFVKGSLSIKVEEFKQYLDKHANKGWVNVDLKESKGGKYYAELNTWKTAGTPEHPQYNPAPSQEEQESVDVSKIPF